MNWISVKDQLPDVDTASMGVLEAEQQKEAH